MIDVVFTFDTTGSMAPCLAQVRRTIRDAAAQLFRDIPDLHIGLMAHGDYCDRETSYVTKQLDLTDDVRALTRFCEQTSSTHGGDSAECYEQVLHEARSFSWRAGKHKVLCMIGDDVPHEPGYRNAGLSGALKLDWRNEAQLLAEAGVKVYGVHCMPGARSHSKWFYQRLAERSTGLYLTLDQFNAVTDLIMAVCYAQQGSAALDKYEAEIRKAGRLTRNTDSLLAALGGTPAAVATATAPRRRTAAYSAAADLEAVPAGRFQALHVPSDATIRDFVEAEGLRFEKGRGFYEFTKTETIQPKKEIVLQHRASGDVFTGAKARELLGLPRAGTGENERVKPTADVMRDWRVYVQSTSVNRKLIGGTSFLYEVADGY